MKSKVSTNEEAAGARSVRGVIPTPADEVHLPVPVAGKRAVNPQIRHEMIACAAYYRAESRGFCGGSEVEDWLEAEAEIDHALTGTAFQFH